MRPQSRYRGFASFDALFSLVPMTMMLLFLLNFDACLTKQAGERMERQQTFDRLASVADYTVKSGAVMRNGSVRHPNWIDGAKISEEYIEDLRARSGLWELRVSVGDGWANGGPDDAMEFCICRLALVGGDKRIARIFVCGR
jgi:hypothetical protein